MWAVREPPTQVWSGKGGRSGWWWKYWVDLEGVSQPLRPYEVVLGWRGLMGNIWVIYDGGMRTERSSTKCSGTVLSGQRCKAWAVRGSEPPLCAVHAGLNKGAGAPKGNRNALKHGFYSPGMTRKEKAWLTRCGENASIEGELALIRICLLRLTKYQMDENLSPEQSATISKMMIAAARTIAYLDRRVKDLGYGEDWDEVLDNLAEMMGVEL